MDVILGLIFWGLVIYYFVRRSKRKKLEKQKLLQAIENSRQESRAHESLDTTDAEAYLLAQESLKYVDEREEKQSKYSDRKKYFNIFDDPNIETAAKSHRNSPIIITFIYEREDEEGNVISSQERAVHPYYRDEDYLEGFCLDYEAERTFRIDRIARFTGNSKAIFDALDAS
ncbi:WYL domain-containing protein [Ignatzschineria rhizosphaerae]|uniref:WYL domain-containing protein n=1 Tax=Ignatzschineria rhizosphaerae TaxID=2923279 RepID=A0ABY3WZM7_9GAMM|nr:WYL domain-containing protein [Ignatzschineria rhizosphaerae]UNM96059.1 WYL domain-containing protein [Ignatzschineria rhizosphaerae]